MQYLTDFIPQNKPRRSKFEEQGRNWICGCGKAYLSYSARYTHIRDKHGGIIPHGSYPLSSRMGSRVLYEEVGSLFKSQDQRSNYPPHTSEYEPPIQKRAYHSSLIPQRQVVSIFVSDYEFLEEIGVMKDPKARSQDQENCYSPIDNWFLDQRPEVIEEGKELLKIANKVLSERQDNKEKERRGEIPSKLNNLMKPCDWAFADYLLYFAGKAKLSFFKICMRYILALRTFLNVKYSEEDKVYTEFKNAQKVPQNLEEFITQFLPMHYYAFDIPMAILISHHLTNWLNQKNYSSALMNLDTGVPEMTPTRIPRPDGLGFTGPNRIIIDRLEKENNLPPQFY